MLKFGGITFIVIVTRGGRSKISKATGQIITTSLRRVVSHLKKNMVQKGHLPPKFSKSGLGSIEIILICPEPWMYEDCCLLVVCPKLVLFSFFLGMFFQWKLKSQVLPQETRRETNVQTPIGLHTCSPKLKNCWMDGAKSMRGLNSKNIE